MPYYAYCVARLDMDQPWEVFSGLGERPVFAVREQKMAVLVSRVERQDLEDPRSVVQHGQVIHRVFERHTVLPFRFGTVLASEEQVALLLSKNRDQFTEAIRFLRGKVEMHVKLRFRLPESAEPAIESESQAPAKPLALAAAAGAGAMISSGISSSREPRRLTPGRLVVSARGFIASGADLMPPPRTPFPEMSLPAESAEVQAHRIAHHVKETLRPLQEQVSVHPGGEGQMLMDLRYLVEEERIPLCQKLSLQGYPGLRDCQMQVTGPWPPCHFLPLDVKMPARGERLAERPGRLPLRGRAVRV